MLPRIVATDGVVGFHWAFPDGAPARLAELLELPGAEPERWLPTHLEALDDVLIDVVGRFGEVLGGGRGPRPAEREELTAAYVAIDRATFEYAECTERPAEQAAALPVDLRAGQILGTAALVSIRSRSALGLIGPAPFDGTLDDPGAGVIGGQAGMHRVDPQRPWAGGRWLVVTDDGRRLPATLSMLLFDSSGVDKEASLREHREALTEVTDAVQGPDAEPMTACGAVDWLLFDWVMAHRDAPDSGAVQITSRNTGDVTMIVAAAGASVRVRARFDPALSVLAAISRP